MPPPPLPTKKQFQKDTSHSNVLKLRGTIGKIDAALDQWHKQRSLDNTIAVYKECRHWLKAKAGKTTTNSIHRQKKIKYLVDQSLLWLHHFDADLGKARLRFEQKKAAGPRPGLKSLAGVYQHERSLYVQSGKTHAPSGTMLDAKYPEGSFGGKTFGQLTEAEFDALDRHFQRQYPVVYLKKMDRLRDMILIENKVLTTYDGTPLTTTGQGGWPYAIDQYGNLFTKDDHSVQGQFNHSSFNAGNDVVCAGMIRANGGALQSISNNSGHYKPSQLHLYNASRLMVQELGFNARAAKAELWDFVQEPGYINIYEFPIMGIPQAGHTRGQHIHRMPAPP